MRKYYTDRNYVPADTPGATGGYFVGQSDGLRYRYCRIGDTVPEGTVIHSGFINSDVYTNLTAAPCAVTLVDAGSPARPVMWASQHE